MEDFRQAASQYSKAIESVKQAKEKLAEIVIKYLIANGYDPSKCTELVISENLDLPRSTVRSILSDLEDDHILEVKEFGNAKPYVFTMVGIGAAIDYLNLSFTRQETNEILATKEAEKYDGMFSGSYTNGKINGKAIVRYRGQIANDCLLTLIARFFDCVEEWSNEKLREAFDVRTSNELFLLVPEQVSFGMLAPNVKNPFYRGWSTVNILEVGEEKSSPGDIRRLIIQSYEADLKSVIKRLGKFTSLLERDGYEGMHEHFKGLIPRSYRLEGLEKLEGEEQEHRFHDEYLWAATLALRDGCRIGDKLGADLNVLTEARRLADALDLALERGYRGAEVEGMKLIEWSLQQSSPSALKETPLPSSGKSVIAIGSDIILKVAEPTLIDVGQGIARIDPEVAVTLGITPGDAIEISGKKRTFAISRESQPRDRGKRIIRIDKYIRYNAGVSEDDRIRVRKISANHAQSVNLTCTDKRRIDLLKDIKNILLGRIMGIGDSIPIRIMGRIVNLTVKAFEPMDDAVIINEETSVKVE